MINKYMGGTDMKPLSREEIKKVIHGKGRASRIPVALNFWTHPHTFGDRRLKVEKTMESYPEDIHIIRVCWPDIFKTPEDEPSYRWMNIEMPSGWGKSGHDSKIAIKDWNQLDGIIKDFPDPGYRGLIPADQPDDGRYRVALLFFCLYERHWMLRGMENALTDYYLYPKEVHRLMRSLTDFYKAAMVRLKKELHADAVLAGDDLGTQTDSFFSEDIFVELLMI